ncbi:hypothetical protein [Mesorhizobium sp.]|uniref:hypothetical protein n=2 Tax=unclassified Mesorhizobium TaxID=325217 RepID=UPI0012197B52|nr:hypothetical protein [Mesorhizobium sp.]TIQ98005.1 MAG: hypothetical protein E5X36_10285 [Mesorhizobium sp.]
MFRDAGTFFLRDLICLGQEQFPRARSCRPFPRAGFALCSAPMSRNTVLQLIAAVITIAILIVLHKGLDWFFNLMGVGFAMGFISGGLAVFLVWYLADREENSRAAGGIPSAEEQRTRHSIDL